jgi:mRNA degradation ribonuclease J1/J2
MGRSKDLVNKIVDKEQGEIKNWGEFQSRIEKEMIRFLRKETGRDPMVIVHSIFV